LATLLVWRPGGAAEGGAAGVAPALGGTASEGVGPGADQQQEAPAVASDVVPAESAAEKPAEAAVAAGSELAAQEAPGRNEIARDDFGQQELELASRAEGRWKSLVEGDYAAAYGYTLPSYRQIHTLEQYATRFGKAVRWRVAKVQGIRYDSPTIAHLSIDLEADVALPWGGQTERVVTRLYETWLNREGEWWISIAK
jgi:hypothetical protein